RIRAGADFRARAVRVYDADLGRTGGVSGVRGGAVLVHPRRRGDRGAGGSLQSASGKGAASSGGGRLRCLWPCGTTSIFAHRSLHYREPAMFAVVFEVQPRSDRWDAYLGLAGALRPDLVATEGFIDNVRYGSK